jgi:hypothetical protein
MKVRKLLSISFATIILLLCVRFYGECIGFDQGYSLAEQINKESDIKLSGGWPTTYSFLAERYYFMGCFLILFLFGKMLKQEIISPLVCISSLGIIVYQIWLMYALKMERFQSVSNYDILLRDSILFDRFCFFIVLLLLIIEIVNIIAFFARQNEDS